MHKYLHKQDDDCNVIDIGRPVIMNEMNSYAYSYTVLAIYDLPRALASPRKFDVYEWLSPEMIRVGPERTPQLTPPLNPFQDNDRPIVHLNDNLGAPVDIWGFDASLSPFIDIWLTAYRVIDMQRRLCNDNPPFSELVNVSFRNHGLKYNRGLTSVIAVPPVAEPLDPFTLYGREVHR